MSSNLNLKKLCAFCGCEFIAHKTTTTCSLIVAPAYSISNENEMQK